MKYKMALLIAYNGTPFHGLQYQRLPIPTVERVLAEQLVRHGLVKPCNYASIEKMHIKRACRTDKGVHAAMNVVVVNVERNDCGPFLSAMNVLRTGHTDNENNENRNRNGNGNSGSTTGTTSTDSTDSAGMIHVYGMVRVPKTFNPKTRVDHRTYHYVMPQHITGTDRHTLTRVLRMYVGTRDYHNFTNEKEGARTIRLIRDVRVDVIGEWYVVKITGQSFMMHQIRKMVGLVLLVLRHGLGRTADGTGRDVDSKVDRETDNETNRDVDSKANSKTDRDVDRETDTCINSKADKQIDNKVDGDMDSKVDSNADRETDKQIDSKADNKDSKDSKVDAYIVERAQHVFTTAFSPARINIPKAPAHFLYLDSPVYDTYNKQYTMHDSIEVDVCEKERVRDMLIYRYVMNDGCMDVFKQWYECVDKHVSEYGYVGIDNQGRGHE